MSFGWVYHWYAAPWSFIKANIDAAYSGGANTIRIIGSFGVVLSGWLTQAQYDAKWQQVFDYCKSLGMYVYPCCGATGFNADEQVFTYAQIQQQIVAMGVLCQRQTNVIGIDINSEAGNVDQPWVTSATGMRAAVRAVKLVTNIPVTASMFATYVGAWTGDQAALLANGAEFLDIHLYYDPAADDVQTAMWTTMPTLTVLVGEFGQNLGAGSSARTSRYSTVKALVGHVGSLGQRCAGALAWEVFDNPQSSPGAANAYGIFDYPSATPRTDVYSTWASFPIT